MLFCHASQIDLEVGQRWHVLFATTAVFHGGSCYFSVCFDLVWIAAAVFLNKISTSLDLMMYIQVHKIYI